MKIKIYCSLIILTISNLVTAQNKKINNNIHKVMVVERERPAEWNNLVPGGKFIDRFLPMPDLGGTTTKTWGSKNVIPRDVNNGIEEAKWSYWGGNTRLGEDGKYHLFVCRWAENEVEGHMAYHYSIVVHAVANNSFGPYKVIGEIGPGHNPEWYQTKDGTYIIYTTGGNNYKSKNLNGPWTPFKADFDFRERECESKSHNTLHNNTHAIREDGSFLMINRKGDAWFSKDGITNFSRVTPYNVYPSAKAKYEDPVVWKTDIQYHLIVNDWLGRIAWHMRSKDGVNWKEEPGEAYKPGISKSSKGYTENWHKYERIKMVQDKYGRAYQANFAVIDTLKKQDLGSDNHSSKLICVPLVKGRLLSLLNKKKITPKTKEIKLLIKAEKDFDPIKEIDFKSLRFGASQAVNFGKGAKFLSYKVTGKDIVVTFNGENNGITDDNFVGKLIGKTTKGNMLFGYARFSWENYIEPILSPKSVEVIDSKNIQVEVQNFGQVKSRKACIEVYVSKNNQQKLVSKTKIPVLETFEKVILKMKVDTDVSGMSKKDFDIIINKGRESETILKGKSLVYKRKPNPIK